MGKVWTYDISQNISITFKNDTFNSSYINLTAHNDPFSAQL
jgi:hypothetical protein